VVRASSASAATPSKNIVETAAGAPQFSTLVSLVKKAGLVGVLSGKANYTVFAPTDAAFAKVPKKTLNQLAADKAKLKEVLLYQAPGQGARRQGAEDGFGQNRRGVEGDLLGPRQKRLRQRREDHQDGYPLQ
jgi:hypothetical protein